MKLEEYLQENYNYNAEVKKEDIKEFKLKLTKKMNEDIRFRIKIYESYHDKFGIIFRTFKPERYLVRIDEYIIGKRNAYFEIHLGGKFIRIGKFDKNRG